MLVILVSCDFTIDKSPNSIRCKGLMMEQRWERQRGGYRLLRGVRRRVVNCGREMRMEKWLLDESTKGTKYYCS